MVNKSKPPKPPKPPTDPEPIVPQPEANVPPEPAAIPPIQKPTTSHLSRFKSRKTELLGGVPPLLTGLAVLRVGDVGDFMRTHEDDQSEYWSDTMCFCRVPVQGTKGTILHLIDEDIAEANLQPKEILRFQLVLASKPHDTFFFCIKPVENLDNSFNASAIDIIEKARTGWFKPISRKKEGHEDYYAMPARDEKGFDDPKWPTTTRMDDLIDRTFKGHLQITSEDNPGLARLVGRKPKLT